jgi:hypothetical protein
MLVLPFIRRMLSARSVQSVVAQRVCVAASPLTSYKP